MSLSGISIFKSLPTFWTCWLHLFPYRKSVTLPYSSRILNRYSPNLNFTACFDFWMLCVCVQLFCGPCLNSGLGHPCALDTVQKLFLTFPNRQYHQGWEGFEGVSLGFQAGLKFSKVPSLVRFFLWLGSTFLAHRSLGLASFSVFWALPEPVLISAPVGCHPQTTFFPS